MDFIKIRPECELESNGILFGVRADFGEHGNERTNVIRTALF
jgi:hypothetical protein